MGFFNNYIFNYADNASVVIGLWSPHLIPYIAEHEAHLVGFTMAYRPILPRIPLRVFKPRIIYLDELWQTRIPAFEFPVILTHPVLAPTIPSMDSAFKRIQKPDQCSICKQCFASRKSMLRHSRIHTGERPFRCDKCDLFFTRKDNLKAHQKTKRHLEHRPRSR